MGNTEYLIGAHKWLGLKSIGMVESQREIDGKISIEQRYYILSIDSNVQRFATAVRSHWSIENKLHWILDVHLKEDDDRKAERKSARSFSLLKRIALNIVRTKDATPKRSLRRKLKHSAWDENYLLAMLS